MCGGDIRASVLHGAKDLRVESRELTAPEATEVQVEIKATGLCGSDLHYFNHYRNGDIICKEPMALGHESAGVVKAVGSEVSTLKVGDHVALEVGLPCESCDLCKEGRYNICKGMRFRSSAKAFPHFQGTLQDRINHPAKWVHKLPETVSLEYGALVEPLSVAFHARDRANLKPGSTVLILGAGAVGLLCAAAAKVSGAKTVLIADIQEDRVNFAVQNGFADASIVVPMARPQTIEDKLAYAKDLAEKITSTQVKGEAVGEVTVTFECTGVESCMQTAIYSTQAGGKVMIIGMGNPIQTLPLSAAALREVDLVGVFRYANNYPDVINMLASKNAALPDVGKLVTHRYNGFDEIPEAFKMAGQVKDEKGDLVLKVMVGAELNRWCLDRNCPHKMKSQQLLLALAAGAEAKNSLGYMVDYGRCQWHNFLGNFENPFCEYDPAAFSQASVPEPKSERTIHAVATPFVPLEAKPVEVAAQRPAEPVMEKKEEEEKQETKKPADPIPPKAGASKVKSDKLLANELWPIASSCAGHYNRTEEFCIFSNPGFAGGRGITILTTPAEAVAIAKSPAFTNPDLYKNVKDFNAAESDKWHVEEVPNKGMGLVASRNLEMGDHIMSVSAAIMTDFDIWDHVSLDQVRRMQTEGIGHLPMNHREIFMNLSTHDGAESHEEQVYKIILTNAFDISDVEIITRPSDAKSVNFFTVFPEVSRMNHDCRPNAHYYWDPETFTQNVFAVRPILAGEEITITYVELLLPRDQRLERLEETWHFPCACTACTQVDRIVEASDARIAQILALQGQFADYTGSSHATPEMAEALVSLYEQERLWSRLYEAYTFAAIEFNAAGRVWEAVKYARLAVQHGFVAAGPKNEDGYELAALAENPTTHWSYMMRRKDDSGSSDRSAITTSS